MATAQASRQEVSRVSLNVAPLANLVAPLARPARPRSLDLAPATDSTIPGLLRNDSEVLVHGDVPLGLGLRELSQAAGAWVATCLCTIPHPTPNVLLVLEDTAYRHSRPSVAHPASAPHPFGVQAPRNRRNRLTVYELREDSQDNARFCRVDGHLVTVRSGSSTTVDTHFSRWL